MSTKLKAGTSTSGAVLDADTTGILELQSGSTPITAVTIDTSQNVGIGTSSPSAKLDVNKGSAGVLANFTDGVNTNCQISTTSLVATVGPTAGSTALAFQSSGTERMRINSSGDLLVGTGTTGSNGKLEVKNNSGIIAYFYNNAGTGLYLGAGGTSWAVASDERLKTQLIPFQNAVDKISTLRCGTGRYLTDDESVSRSFLIAQDVKQVLPEAVDEREDEAKTLGVRYTEVIPLLVAAIQELNAKVDAQATEIQALKGNA